MVAKTLHRYSSLVIRLMSIAYDFVRSVMYKQKNIHKTSMLMVAFLFVV
jgi:hypothetical protein